MNKTITAVTFAALAAVMIPVEADAAGGGWGRGGGDRVARLAERLELSDEQRGQVEVLFAEMRERREALREEQRERLDEMLTEEQRAQLDEMRASGRGHGRRGRRGPPSDEGAEG